MPGLLHRLALQVYRQLPVGLRRRVVRAVSPSFTVGAMCFIERADGALLLVRHSYRDRWGVPGGLLERGEDAGDGARREVFEEVGLVVDLLGEPAVVVDAVPQRVDVIYRARPAEGVDPETVQLGSAEIIDARWFAPEALPELQFETAGALVALARIATGQRPLPQPVWPRL